MNFSKSIRGFSTFDLLTTVSSVVAVLAVSVPIVHRGVDSRNTDLARVQVKKFAEDLESSFGVTPQYGTRQVASAHQKEPDLGLDPWGQPYRFKMVSNAYGQPSAVMVFSVGPNGKLDSEADLSKASQGADFAFRGDDVGVVKSVR